MKDKITIRRAKNKDIMDIVLQLKAFAEFTEVDYLYSNGTNAYDFVRQLIDNHFVLVAAFPSETLEEKLSGIAGFIAGTVGPHYFNPEISVLSEILWWVTPKYRRSPAAKMLLDEFVEWGETNCDWTLLSLDKNSPVNERAFLKRGFHLKERVFLKESHGRCK